MENSGSCSRCSGALLLAVALGGVLYIGGQWVGASNEPQNATITVTGEGTSFAAPDIAEISVGVQTGRQTTADRAMTILSERMDAVIAAVKEQGITDADIKTEHFWLNPVYDYTEQGQVPRGFEANQSLRIKVRALDKASAVLGAATQAGANQAGNIQFTIDDPDELRDAAREEAITEAQSKATVLATQLGVRLGKLIGFGEGGMNGYPVPMMEAYGRGGGMDTAAMEKVQLPAGEQEIAVSVSLTYELR